MTLTYTTRPLSDRAWLRRPEARTASQFRVTWTQAQDALERELDRIDGRDLVIEVDVDERDLRLDGRLRANARPTEPAVIVSFTCARGPLMFRSDAYDRPYWSRSMPEGWQHNVYAVALTLEALRAVDRYGATASAQQYTGFRQIGASPAIVTEPPLDRRAAAQIVAAAVFPGHDNARFRDVAVDELLTDDRTVALLGKHARRYAHPDAGGTAEAFQRIERALAVLRGAR